MTRPVLDPCCGSRMFWFNRADPCLHGEAVEEVRRKPASAEIALEFIAAGGSEDARTAARPLADLRAALAKIGGA